jgi:drug/metabolite transporter (DMT)-like permease
MLLYLEPAVSVLGALAFLREHVRLATIAGGLLILAGVAASTTRRSPGSGTIEQSEM